MSIQECACGGRWVREDCSFDAHGYDGRLRVISQSAWICEDCGDAAADTLSAAELSALDEPFESEWEPES